jgi:predicted branched-subunit amino acid permease
VIFSALLGPHFSHLPLWQRFYLGYISGDVSIALFLQRYPDRHARARQAVLPEGPDVSRTGSPGRSAR